MRVDRLLERLRRHDAPEAWLDTARSLGHTLSGSKAQELRAAVSGLARVPAGDEYRRGMRDALVELLQAYEVEVDHHEERDAAVAELESGLRHNARLGQIVRALAARPCLPTEIAEDLDTDAATVSRVLATLRDQGLVEAFQSEADRRTRPHRLTALGRRVAASLESKLPAAAAAAVRLAVDALAHVAVAGGARREWLIEQCHPKARRHGFSSENLVDHALSCADKRGLVRHKAASTLVSWRSDPLDRSVSCDLHLDVLERVRQATAHQGTVVVRTNGRRDAWQAAVSRWDGDGVMVLGPSDVRFTKTPEEGFLLLYDTCSAWVQDREDGSARALFDKAIEIFCVPSPGESTADLASLDPDLRFMPLAEVSHAHGG